jgi:hypothetical protein
MNNSCRALVMAAATMFSFAFPGTMKSTATQEKAAVGAFEAHGDVGNVLHAGSLEYDGTKKSYTIDGSGKNMCL